MIIIKEKERGKSGDCVCVSFHPEMTLSSGADSATDLDQLSVNLSFPASETRKRKCHSFTVTDDSDVEEVQEQYRSVQISVSHTHTLYVCTYCYSLCVGSYVKYANSM